jgi:lipoprotein-anchoring transpeptidase ErfK/SrfK
MSDMNIGRDRLLLTVPIAALLMAVPASAQTYYGGSSIYSEPLPPPGGQNRYEDAPYATGSVPQFQRSGRYYVPSYETDEVGPPGLLDHAPPPVYGHQLKPPPVLPGVVEFDPEPIRPPRAVGARPSSALVASQPARAPAPAVQAGAAAGDSVMSLPPEDQPEIGTPKALPENLKRQLVDYQTREPAGTIIIDTPNTYLYLVLGHGKALRYGIGVGREGFTWSGTQRISLMKQWPDWTPPPEMIQRQPYLPRIMAGGPGNPLGARALYLGGTLYRIHGTNQPSTIGQTVSSGCIRLLNEDIEDLYRRVQVGTRVVVLPGRSQENVASAHPVYTASPVR